MGDTVLICKKRKKKKPRCGPGVWEKDEAREGTPQGFAALLLGGCFWEGLSKVREQLLSRQMELVGGSQIRNIMVVKMVE